MSGNNVTIVGNVTRDPELRFTPSGQANARIGVAVNRKWQDRNSGEWQEATSFFDVICWRELAENVSESLKKGTRVIVTGRLEQRSWSRRGTSAASSRSTPTRSPPACGGPRPRSRRPSAAAAETRERVGAEAVSAAPRRPPPISRRRTTTSATSRSDS